VKIDPKAKLMIDAVVDTDTKGRDRRGWSFWLTVAVLSAVAVGTALVDALPAGLRFTLAILGCIGAVLFLTFLSTKPFGRNFYNGPNWWW
jgi:hypothetical protein